MTTLYIPDRNSICYLSKMTISQFLQFFRRIPLTFPLICFNLMYRGYRIREYRRTILKERLTNMGKLDIKKQQKREALLNTAFDLFTSKGLHKTSISDIVQQANVAKGTFYLYFEDKYDLCNKLIAYKASQLFAKAYTSMQQEPPMDIEAKILYLVSHIVDSLENNKTLLTFISKNLSWGIFKAALTSPPDSGNINFTNIYLNMLQNDEVAFNEPEIMLYFIIELTGSTCYSSILYDEPVPPEQLKPYLYKHICSIIENHKKH